MESIFCNSCGTLIPKGVGACPFCHREVDWSTGVQPPRYIFETSTPLSKEKASFPSSLFSEQPNAQKATESGKEPSAKKVETISLPDMDNLLEGAYTLEPEQDPLHFGEMLLLILAALFPVVGAIILAIVAFTGGDTKVNRQTAAKALLVAHFILTLFVIALGMSVLNYLTMLLAYPLY